MWLISWNSTFLFNENEPSFGGTCPRTQTFINTQTCIHTFPNNYRLILKHFFPLRKHARTHKVLPSTSQLPENTMRAQVAVLDACSGRWQCRCYLVALCFPLCVCACLFAGQLWWPAAHFTKALATPQMVDPNRYSKRREERTNALSLMHAHTLAYTCVGTLRSEMLALSH